MRNVPELIDDSKAIKSSKILFIACLGHAMELYDYVLYGVMLPFIASKFFPETGLISSALLGYLSLALVVLITPLGSIFWGWYGDRFGKSSMLTLSISFMAIASLAISILPTYHEIGLFAPILLVFFRIMQGISASGEIIGAKIFAMEVMGEKSYGISSSIITASGACGVLLAMYMGYLASISKIEDFWRFAFLLGFILFAISAAIRISLAKQLGIKKNSSADKITTVFTIIRNHPYEFLTVFVLGAMLGIFSYSSQVFINPFMIKRGLSKQAAYGYSIYSYVSTIIVAISFGLYIDKYLLKIQSSLSILKKNLLYNSLVSFIAFSLLLSHNHSYNLMGYIILGGAIGSYACVCSIVIYKAFPSSVRCRGVMLSYALGCGMFSGSTPFILDIISRASSYLPMIFLSGCFLLTYIILTRSAKHVDVL